MRNFVSLAALAAVMGAPVLAKAQAVPATVQLTSGNAELELEIAGSAETFLEADVLTFEAQGPQVLELRLHLLSKRKKRKGTLEGTVTLVRDGSEVAAGSFATDVAKKGNKAGKGKGKVSPAVIRHVQVPDGKHSFRMTFEAPAKSLVAAKLSTVAAVDKSILIGDWVEPAPAPAPVKRKPEPAPPPPPTPPSPPDEPPPAAEPAPGHVDTERTTIRGESSAEPEPEPAPAKTIAPIEVTKADGTVTGATEVLANAVASAWENLGRETPFFRVAVPYFEELGESVEENHLGKLVPELLSAALAEREQFVVVERERLDQVMREHRLSGLGIVDDSTAAEFGKVLGAQGLITGTIGEAGPSYIVTVKVVEVESGQVLVSGRVEIERAGLVALSSDAVVMRSKAGAGIRSALVPGWGQLYNGDSVKGGLMMTAWAVIFAAGGAFTALRVIWGAQYDSATDITPDEVAALREEGNIWGQTANVIWAVYGVLWAASIIDAIVNGQDFATVEVGTRVEAEAAGLRFTF